MFNASMLGPKRLSIVCSCLAYFYVSEKSSATPVVNKSAIPESSRCTLHGVLKRVPSAYNNRLPSDRSDNRMNKHFIYPLETIFGWEIAK